MERLLPRVRRSPAASRLVLAFVLACAPLLLTPSRALAGDGLGVLVPVQFGFAAGALGQNAAFTIDDILMARRGVHPSRADGAFELGFSLPQIIGWAAIVATMGFYEGGGERGQDVTVNKTVFIPALVGAAWSLALAGHGLWAIATAPDPAPREVTSTPRATPLRLSLAPTFFGGAGISGGGVGVFGTF